MNISVTPEEERFYKNTMVMAQAIYDSIKKLYDAGYKTVQPEMVDLTIRLISAFEKHYLIQEFITNTYDKCWDSIKIRNENFFLTNANDIFKHLPMNEINLFRDLFLTKDKNGKSVVSQNLKEELWDLFDTLIKICIKYIHKHRDPYSYSKNDEVVNCYGAIFFEEVDIDYHAKNWNIKLEYPPKI